MKVNNNSSQVGEKKEKKTRSTRLQTKYNFRTRLFYYWREQDEAKPQPDLAFLFTLPRQEIKKKKKTNCSHLETFTLVIDRRPLWFLPFKLASIKLNLSDIA